MNDFITSKDLYIVSLNQVRLSKDTKVFYYYCEFLDNYLMEIHVDDFELSKSDQLTFVKYQSSKALLLGTQKFQGEVF